MKVRPGEHVRTRHTYAELEELAVDKHCRDILHSDPEASEAPNVIMLLTDSEPLEVVLDAGTNERSFLHHISYPLDSLVYERHPKSERPRGAKVHIRQGVMADLNVWTTNAGRHVHNAIWRHITNNHQRIMFDPRQERTVPNKIQPINFKIKCRDAGQTPYVNDDYLGILGTIHQAKERVSTTFVMRYRPGAAVRFARYMDREGFTYFTARDTRILSGSRILM